MGRKQEGACFGLLIMVVWLCVAQTALAETEEEIKSRCKLAQGSCRECIGAHYKCSWCGEEDVESTIPINKERCRIYEENQLNCNISAISHPSSSSNITIDNPFTDAGPDFFDNDTNVGVKVTQMRPQEITLRLRPGDSHKVNVTFRKVIDYPLDLYYVMDLSNSMNDDLATLQGLGTSLFSDIKANVTKNVQLGFGSFVDKVMMPFASTVPEQLENPCVKQETDNVCAPPFGFRHQVNITSDQNEFAEAIKATNISGNIDSPEGSFDALMQIAVCNHTHWRDGATHVILLTTDASPHIAMDGKLAAILEANDMSCHMKVGANSRIPSALVYSKSKTMDYPSLGQLKKVFEANKIHSIYAVTETVIDIYRKIPDVIDNAYVAELSNDSSNIIPLIEDTYNELKGRLALVSPVLPSNVQMTYRVFCPNKTMPKTDSLQCDNIEIGDEVVFEFKFDVASCPTDINKKDSIVFRSSSIQDEVKINIEYICDCDCANNAGNSTRCSSRGSLACGVCQCESGRTGSQCQCDEMVDGDSVTEKCKKPGSDSYCEDHGQCDCGVCICESPIYHGDFCECKNTGCPSNEDGLCGGADKGNCSNCNNLGLCVCNPGYSHKPTDKTCSCHDKYCKEENSDKVCSGRGQCDCDTCVCNNTLLYSGQYCQSCIHPDCTGVTATCSGDFIRKCAECLNENQRLGKGSSACTQECEHSYLTYEYVDSFLECSSCTQGTETPTCVKCSKHSETQYKPQQCTSTQTDNQCKVNYQVVWLESNKFMVYVKRFNNEEDCPQPIDPIMIVLPVVGSIVVIGLVILAIWKALQTLRDKRQYQEFLKEEDNRKWTQGQNPIFEKPSSNFANPTFVGAPEDE